MKKLIDRHYFRLRAHPNHWVRKGLGVALVIGGLLGFLPVLGYWMLPLGLGLLAADWPLARRAYRRLLSWWGRQARALRLKAPSAAQRRKAAGTPGRDSDP